MPTTKKKTATAKDKYIEAVGRRRTAVARVRVYPSKKAPAKGFDILVNEKPYTEYFPLSKHHQNIVAPFVAVEENFPVSVQVKGGGVESQAEAIRMGIARVISEHKEEYKSKMRTLGYLTRDPRVVERKKYGKRKSRRPQQWRKR